MTFDEVSINDMTFINWHLLARVLSLSIYDISVENCFQFESDLKWNNSISVELNVMRAD